jgi:phage-related tail fiber protein
MADSTLNRFLSAGTAVQRVAYTPSPPTPPSGPTPGYFWHETDTGDTYSWKAGTGWIKVNGAAASFTSWKDEVRAATTANGTLASAFENGDTIDGVVLATGDRILIKDQTSGSENGIYVVAASGAPTRATDADTGAEMLGAIVPVMEGTVNADKVFKCTNNATITINTTALVFIETLDLATAGSQGDILYRGANGWVRLAAGTAGKFLKTLGAGANPAWAASNALCSKFIAQTLTAAGSVTAWSINSTTYTTFQMFNVSHDFTFFPATHFRLYGRAQSNEAAQTIKLQMQSAGGTAWHTGTEDVTITNTLANFDSGWLTIDSVPSGFDVSQMQCKGSNSTVDLSLVKIMIDLKIDP